MAYPKTHRPIERMEVKKNGFALLTVLLVSIIGFMFIFMAVYLTSKGLRTYSSSKNYAKVVELAEASLEESIAQIETSSYEALENPSQPGHLGPIFVGGIPTGTGETATYELWRVFWKPLSGMGGAIVFPPISSAYSGVAGVCVFYLSSGNATRSSSAANIYMLYAKEY